MKKILFSIAVNFLVLLICSGSSLASWSFDLTTDYTPGDNQAVFEIVLNTNESITLSGYALSFYYDIEELKYTGHNNSPESSWGLMKDIIGKFSVDEAAGSISNFNAMSFSPVDIAPGSYALGTLSFDIVDSIIDGNSDIMWDINDPMISCTINGTGYDGKSGSIAEVLTPAVTDTGTVTQFPYLLQPGSSAPVCSV